MIDMVITQAPECRLIEVLILNPRAILLLYDLQNLCETT